MLKITGEMKMKNPDLAQTSNKIIEEMCIETSEFMYHKTGACTSHNMSWSKEHMKVYKKNLNVLMPHRKRSF